MRGPRGEYLYTRHMLEASRGGQWIKLRRTWTGMGRIEAKNKRQRSTKANQLHLLFSATMLPASQPRELAFPVTDAFKTITSSPASFAPIVLIGTSNPHGCAYISSFTTFPRTHRANDARCQTSNLHNKASSYARITQLPYHRSRISVRPLGLGCPFPI